MLEGPSPLTSHSLVCIMPAVLSRREDEARAAAEFIFQLDRWRGKPAFFYSWYIKSIIQCCRGTAWHLFILLRQMTFPGSEASRGGDDGHRHWSRELVQNQTSDCRLYQTGAIVVPGQQIPIQRERLASNQGLRTLPMTTPSGPRSGTINQTWDH